jgi:hypothetical protein
VPAAAVAQGREVLKLNETKGNPSVRNGSDPSLDLGSTSADHAGCGPAGEGRGDVDDRLLVEPERLRKNIGPPSSPAPMTVHRCAAGMSATTRNTSRPHAGRGPGHPSPGRLLLIEEVVDVLPAGQVIISLASAGTVSVTPMLICSTSIELTHATSPLDWDPSLPRRPVGTRGRPERGSSRNSVEGSRRGDPGRRSATCSRTSTTRHRPDTEAGILSPSPTTGTPVCRSMVSSGPPAVEVRTGSPR